MYPNIVRLMEPLKNWSRLPEVNDALNEFSYRDLWGLSGLQTPSANKFSTQTC